MRSNLCNLEAQYKLKKQFWYYGVLPLVSVYTVGIFVASYHLSRTVDDCFITQSCSELDNKIAYFSLNIVYLPTQKVEKTRSSMSLVVVFPVNKSIFVIALLISCAGNSTVWLLLIKRTIALDRHDETSSIASFCLTVVSNDSAAFVLEPPILFSICLTSLLTPVPLVADTEKTFSFLP